MIFDRADDKTCHDFPWVQQVSQLRCPNAMPDVNAGGVQRCQKKMGGTGNLSSYVFRLKTLPFLELLVQVLILLRFTKPNNQQLIL